MQYIWIFQNRNVYLPPTLHKNNSKAENGVYGKHKNLGHTRPGKEDPLVFV